MSHKPYIALILFLFMLGGLITARPLTVNASPQRQVAYQTPTPLPDGRIIYLVEPNDTCLRIQLLTGVTVQQLIIINKLDEACTLTVGKQLILAVITPTSSPTPNPQFTATALLPTPTPFRGTGSICVQLYNDINGNGFQEDNEGLIAGGVASISDPAGKISNTGTTTSDPAASFCQEVPEGQYNVSMAVPDGYNPTTGTNLLIPVQAGNIGFVNFGAQVSSIAVINNPAPNTTSVNPAADNSRNMLLAVVGGLLLLAGAGLGVYVIVMRRG